ncbi:MAG TPA: zinc ribbon domain-containing protein [Candidatus Omnitrophica bacterium]|nr:zinc ribbon domain-containing protein [Candidatus Omnitrophota bacterium]
MPTYDYECLGCGYTFEMFQKINEEPLKNCPQCKGMLKRLIGAGCGLIFKGSGFFITDYKRNFSKDKKDTSSKSKDESKKNNKDKGGQ